MDVSDGFLLMVFFKGFFFPRIFLVGILFNKVVLGFCFGFPNVFLGFCGLLGFSRAFSSFP